MNWKKKVITLGTIPVGKKQTVIFEALVPLQIRTLTSSCGCTTPKYNEENNTVEVAYTPGRIPYHLQSKGEQQTTKTVTVYYVDGTNETLSIKATVKN